MVESKKYPLLFTDYYGVSGVIKGLSWKESIYLENFPYSTKLEDFNDFEGAFVDQIKEYPLSDEFYKSLVSGKFEIELNSSSETPLNYKTIRRKGKEIEIPEFTCSSNSNIILNTSSNKLEQLKSIKYSYLNSDKIFIEMEDERLLFELNPRFSPLKVHNGSATNKYQILNEYEEYYVLLRGKHYFDPSNDDFVFISGQLYFFEKHIKLSSIFSRGFGTETLAGKRPSRSLIFSCKDIKVDEKVDIPDEGVVKMKYKDDMFLGREHIRRNAPGVKKRNVDYILDREDKYSIITEKTAKSYVERDSKHSRRRGRVNVHHRIEELKK